MKKRIFLSVAGLALATIALAGCSSMGGGTASSPSAAAHTPASASGASTGGALATAKTSLGTIVVNGKGRSVYLYTKDTANSGMSTCYGQCAAVWPAVTTTSAKPSVTGVSGTIGTIKRTDGTMQVTLNGWPLYTFADDTAAGQTSGQGLMNSWYVLSPSGTEIKAAASTSSGSSTSGSSTSGSSSTGSSSTGSSGGSSSGSSAGGGWS
jgi:predicted lipoprotein with Yx(FWY)xxD motif